MKARKRWFIDKNKPSLRTWESSYRRRLRFDSVLRSTHAVNCGGGCRFDVYCRDGVLIREEPATDYLPPYEGIPQNGSRVCPAGLSASAYIDHPARVKSPLVRAPLLETWKKARSEFADPVEAWASIEAGSEPTLWKELRGRGDFRRTDWDTVLELVAAAAVHTIKSRGPDRIWGYSSSAAPALVSSASGHRFLQLLGGVQLSSSDWEGRLNMAALQVWGDPIEVPEAADWYNARFLVIQGDEFHVSHCPDSHFLLSARENGTKVWVLGEGAAPERYSDERVRFSSEDLATWWRTVNHVILQENYREKPPPFLSDYLQRYTDAPILVELRKEGEHWRTVDYLRVDRLSAHASAEEGRRKVLFWDEAGEGPQVAPGAIGFLHQKGPGGWNLQLQDDLSGVKLKPALTLLDPGQSTVPVEFWQGSRRFVREVPVRRAPATDDGDVIFATVFDLMLAEQGVDRTLPIAELPSDPGPLPWTPAGFEEKTGVSAETVIRFAREMVQTALRSKGRCMILGSGAALASPGAVREAIHALMLCGCVGTNGGGAGFYSGQRKIIPLDSWRMIALARDWVGANRIQSSSVYYVMGKEPEIGKVAKAAEAPGRKSPSSFGARRRGQLALYLQKRGNPLDLDHAGGGTIQTPETLGVRKPGRLEETGPTLFLTWNSDPHWPTGPNCSPIHLFDGANRDQPVRIPAPKLHLIVDLNHRLTPTNSLADIIFPTSTFYEKEDLNSTELTQLIQPVASVVPPVGESCSEWEIFRRLAKRVSNLAKRHLPEPVCDRVPGVPPYGPASEGGPESGELTAEVWRDYTEMEGRFVSLGPRLAESGLQARGISYRFGARPGAGAAPAVSRAPGASQGTLLSSRDVCDRILELSAAINGWVAERAFQELERRSGVSLREVREEIPRHRILYDDLQRNPVRQLTTPIWSGLSTVDRPYSPFSMNVRFSIPWLTLTGRQQFYPATSRGGPARHSLGDEDLQAAGAVPASAEKSEGIVLQLQSRPPNWCFGSYFADVSEVQNLGEGTDTVWLSPYDAAELRISEGGWVEIESNSRKVMARCRSSRHVRKGTCLGRISGRDVIVGPEGHLAESPGSLFGPSWAGTAAWAPPVFLDPFDFVWGVNLQVMWMAVRVRKLDSIGDRGLGEVSTEEED